MVSVEPQLDSVWPGVARREADGVGVRSLSGRRGRHAASVHCHLQVARASCHCLHCGQVEVVILCKPRKFVMVKKVIRTRAESFLRKRLGELRVGKSDHQVLAILFPENSNIMTTEVWGVFKIWSIFNLPKNVTGFPTVPCVTSLTLMAVTSYT